MDFKEYVVKVSANGDKLWYINGKLHREDGPAIEYADGAKFWYLNGQIHREDGPAIEYASGTKEWYLNGQRHREDGPACEYVNGDKEWYLNGQIHREDGPAYEGASGSKLWYINGQGLTEEEFNKRTKSATCDDKMTDMYRTAQLNQALSGKVRDLEDVINELDLAHLTEKSTS